MSGRKKMKRRSCVQKEGRKRRKRRGRERRKTKDRVESFLKRYQKS